MPAIQLLFFRDGDDVPAFDWLMEQSAHAQNRCVAALAELQSLGHEARRPLVENLGCGIYELRIRVGRVNCRFLYFFFARTAVVLTSGFSKEREIPASEIRQALLRKQRFEADPERHHASN